VRGEVAVIPAGVPTLWRWGEQAADRLHLYLDPALLEGVAAEAGLGREGFEVFDGLCARDPLVEHVGLSLLSELETGGPVGPLYAESLAHALAAHVVREHSSLGGRAARRLDRRPGRGLSRRALRRAIDRCHTASPPAQTARYGLQKKRANRPILGVVHVDLLAPYVLLDELLV